MKKLLFVFLILGALVSCKQTEKAPKIKCYAWLHGPGKSTDAEIKTTFTEYKNKGIDALLYSGGHDPMVYSRVGKIAKQVGLEFHAWIPTMVQDTNPLLKPELYAVNGKGESAFDKPAYVPYYKFLCPNREEVKNFLVNLYSKVAEIPEVDGVHLDYIRFPDVILAKGLWKKYNLVMDKEYPQFDYCYCDKCVSDFKAKTGIDIKAEKDPSQIQEWKQFRYDLITAIANKLSETAHAKNKMITAAVFPGPNSVAKQIVRQEWNKWNLDAFFPMNYNDFYLEKPEWVGRMCKEAVTLTENKKPVFSGLFICPDPAKKISEPDPENHGLLPSEIGEAIQVSMENGAAGICLFTPERMTADAWKAFEEAIYKKYTKK